MYDIFKDETKNMENLINSYQKYFISFMQLKSTVILGNPNICYKKYKNCYVLYITFWRDCTRTHARTQPIHAIYLLSDKVWRAVHRTRKYMNLRRNIIKIQLCLKKSVSYLFKI